MRGLGFHSYIAQGSDIGGGVIDGLASMDPACKGSLSPKPVSCFLVFDLEPLSECSRRIASDYRAHADAYSDPR